MKPRWFHSIVFLLAIAGQRSLAAEVDLSKLPRSSTNEISFARDIKPILDRSCIRCHGTERPKSRFRLDDREAALRGGEDNKDDIVSGDSAHSKLIQYVSGLDPEMVMPPKGKGDPLTATEIALLRGWIDQGVAWDSAGRPEPQI